MESLTTQTFKVEGMTCGHCARTVERAVTAVPGVAKAAVSLTGKKLDVTYDPTRATPAAFKTAVAEAGYEVL